MGITCYEIIRSFKIILNIAGKIKQLFEVWLNPDNKNGFDAPFYNNEFISDLHILKLRCVSFFPLGKKLKSICNVMILYLFLFWFQKSLHDLCSCVWQKWFYFNEIIRKNYSTQSSVNLQKRDGFFSTRLWRNRESSSFVALKQIVFCCFFFLCFSRLVQMARAIILLFYGCLPRTFFMFFWNLF